MEMSEDGILQIRELSPNWCTWNTPAIYSLVRHHQGDLTYWLAPQAWCFKELGRTGFKRPFG